MIRTITIDDRVNWDKIVCSFNNYDINYLWGYARAFQIHGEGEPILFYYEDSTTRAINVIMKRDISRCYPFINKLPYGKWLDISTPYGYGGFWVEGKNFAAINKEYHSYCQEEGYISEFVRFNLFTGFENHYEGHVENYNCNVVRSLDLPLDEMFGDFEHKVRKNLKRASAMNLSCEIDFIGTRINDFLNIYYATMDRTNADKKYLFSKSFFEALNAMKENIVYFHILSEGRVISTELVLYANENCYSFLGGTNADYFQLRPNEFLKLAIIKWAKDMGIKRFILGGGHRNDDGIFKYKKSLAPNGVCNFYIGKKIFEKDRYNKLVDIRKQEQSFNEKSDFFPLYRI